MSMPLSLDFLLAQGDPFPSSPYTSPPGILQSLPLLLLPSPASGELPVLMMPVPTLISQVMSFYFSLVLSASRILKSFSLHHLFPPPLPFLVHFVFQAHLPHVLLPFMWD